MIRGAKTCADVHGYCTPPQVSAITHAAELPVIIALPLQTGERLTDPIPNNTYTQSTLDNFSRSVPGGVLSLKNTRTRQKATPEIGRFRSSSDALGNRRYGSKGIQTKEPSPVAPSSKRATHHWPDSRSDSPDPTRTVR